MEILKIDEETWHQKSRATWLSNRDLNTKHFHNYTNQRCINNSIWELSDENGGSISGQETLKMVAKIHFQNIFIELRSTLISEQSNVVYLFPRFFTKEEGRSVVG